MKTMELNGQLLNLYVSLTLGATEGEDLFFPFDDWEHAGVTYKGQYFEPEKNIAQVWPLVLKLRISAQDVGDGRWVVTLPAPTDSQAVPFPPYYCTNPQIGYLYAIVWSFFGAEVPNSYQSVDAGLVDLTAFHTATKQDESHFEAKPLISSWHAQTALEGVKTAIRRDADENCREFSNFDAFFNWYDVLTGYDQMDEEESIEGHKEMLKVAYAQLVAEGFFTENAATGKA